MADAYQRTGGGERQSDAEVRLQKAQQLNGCFDVLFETKMWF